MSVEIYATLGEPHEVAATLSDLRYLVFQGLKGDTGDSAYEEAVALGFVGTEAEWIASLKGEKGDTGYSPEIRVTDIPGGHKVDVYNELGFESFNVMDGIDGTDGTDGEDGVSPTVTVTDIAGGHRVTITDATHPQGQNFAVMNGSGIPEDVKVALLDCFENVAWINDQGQTYYDALYAALYPPKTLVSISAVFTQGSAVIYDTDSLDTLKQYLTVTATYDDTSTGVVTNYTLSGTLTVGTSTITVLYNGKTTTFIVTVSEHQYQTGYTTVGNPTIDSQYRMTTSDGNFIKTPFNFDNGGKSWELRGKFYFGSDSQPIGASKFYDVVNMVDENNASTRGILVEVNMNSNAQPYLYKFNPFLSSGTESWNIKSPTSESVSIQNLYNGDVYFKTGWTGTKYYIAASPDGTNWNGSYYYEFESQTSIMTGYPIAFGNKRSIAWGYCIYVNSLELDIDGSLYWKAVG